VGWDPSHIRKFLEFRGVIIQEWDKVRTDRLTIRQGTEETAGNGEVPVA